MATELRAGARELRPLTDAGLAVLATASGIYTYLGVRGLLAGTGVLTIGAAVAYSLAVSVGIFVFWRYMATLLPPMRSNAGRLGLVLCMLLGSGAIICMSSWLNAAALAGNAAVEQHLARSVETYQERLGEAHENALAVQGLLPDIELAHSRFADLAAREADGGELTGFSGAGSVTAFLDQTARQLGDLAQRVRASRGDVQDLFAEGQAHLAKMRALLAERGPVDGRMTDFASEAVELSGILTNLQQTSVAPAVRRIVDNVPAVLIAPAASGQSATLRTAQEEAAQNILRAITDQSQLLAAAAAEVAAAPPVEPVRFTPVSSAEAVILYADQFVPSWAGAIAIDLLPMVLVLILAICHQSTRTTQAGQSIAERMTLSELRDIVAYMQEAGVQIRPAEQARDEDDHEPERPAAEAPEPSAERSEAERAPRVAPSVVRAGR
jgi:hypothetical protein